ncbi:ABC transporter permease subunit [Kangiella sp. HZ709]|uniref:ABC transporter permease subunit n=1 Tax=Kangiella sp. HZ709 TaxID=2666328 RepID=UPI0014160D54|nr:ABC transporter permease subunit [Kangiella sp. HZ709]
MLISLLRIFVTALISLIGLTVITFAISLQSSIPLHDYQSHSVFVQYFEYLGYLFQANWGTSNITGSDVLSEFLKHFPATLELLLFALLIVFICGISLGIVAAKNRGTWIDNSVMGATLVGYSMPIFWWGLLLVLFFSLFLGIFPVAGRIDYQYYIEPISRFMLVDTLIGNHSYGLSAFFNALNHLILPAITLSWVPMAIMARMTRSALVNILKFEYVRTARSKGLSENRIIWVHALRNALQSLLTIGGLQISILMTGIIITEHIFAWPGVGNWLLRSVARQDYPSIQGGILALSFMVIIFNVFIDIISNFLDPKKRRPLA